MLRTRQALAYSIIADIMAVMALIGGYVMYGSSPSEVHLIGAVLMGIGIACLLFGTYLFAQAASRITRIQRFRHRGRKILARVLRVKHTVTNDDDTYQLVVESKDAETGKTRELTSDPMPEHPGVGIEGSNVDVLVDPDRPDDYLVDVRPYKKNRVA